ncbi:Hypothetical_protein [Hexamita inflata]|uniref:Hypothetical_protein n=1 Tax=Hexamita inflata TaxID=28002 RepID=A0AA86RFA3_9EUKA|nr:Hypothetical protein HINF_LOCUS59557 [Hexamita inflata]
MNTNSGPEPEIDPQNSEDDREIEEMVENEAVEDENAVQMLRRAEAFLLLGIMFELVKGPAALAILVLNSDYIGILGVALSIIGIIGLILINQQNILLVVAAALAAIAVSIYFIIVTALEFEQHVKTDNIYMAVLGLRVAYVISTFICAGCAFSFLVIIGRARNIPNQPLPGHELVIAQQNQSKRHQAAFVQVNQRIGHQIDKKMIKHLVLIQNMKIMIESVQLGPRDRRKGVLFSPNYEGQRRGSHQTGEPEAKTGGVL